MEVDSYSYGLELPTHSRHRTYSPLFRFGTVVAPDETDLLSVITTCRRWDEVRQRSLSGIFCLDGVGAGTQDC